MESISIPRVNRVTSFHTLN